MEVIAVNSQGLAGSCELQLIDQESLEEIHHDFPSRESDADGIQKILIPGPPPQYDGEDQSRLRRGAVPIERQAPAESKNSLTSQE
jgi:hypothetical protein